MRLMLVLLLTILSLAVSMKPRQTHDSHSIYSNFYALRPELPTSVGLEASALAVLSVFGCSLLCIYTLCPRRNPAQIAPVIDQNNLSNPITPEMNQRSIPTNPPCQPSFSQPLPIKFNYPLTQPMNPYVNQPIF